MNTDLNMKWRDTPWHVWGCISIAFTIPFAKKFVPGFILLLGLSCIWFCIKQRSVFFDKKQTPFLLLTAIFILHLCGLSYSDHVSEGLNEVGIKLSYVVFPVIAWMMPLLSKNELRKILLAFVGGCIAFVLLALSYGLYRTSLFADLSYLSYEKLGIFLHPTYAATYMSMALFILIRNASLADYVLSKQWLNFLLCCIIIVFISMLASKAGFIAALISMVMGAWCWWKNKKSWISATAILFSAIALMAASSLLAPGSSVRLSAAVNDIEIHTPTEMVVPQQHEAHTSTELRFVTWGASFELLLQNPWGVGTGDTEYELIKKYNHMNEGYAAERKLNAHNQFLQAGAEHGWLGISLLTTCLLALLISTIKHRDTLLMNFILLCGMNFLFESFLEVQAGIVFFCFWVMIFLKQARASVSAISS